MILASSGMASHVEGNKIDFYGALTRKRVWYLVLGVSALQVLRNITFWQSKNIEITQETQERNLPIFINTGGEIWQASPSVLEWPPSLRMANDRAFKGPIWHSL